MSPGKVVASSGPRWEVGKLRTREANNYRSEISSHNRNRRHKYKHQHTNNTQHTTNWGHWERPLQTGTLLLSPAPVPIRIHSARRSSCWLQPDGSELALNIHTDAHTPTVNTHSQHAQSTAARTRSALAQPTKARTQSAYVPEQRTRTANTHNVHTAHTVSIRTRTAYPRNQHAQRTHTRTRTRTHTHTHTAMMCTNTHSPRP